MKILHISNDFSLTKVHSNLYRALDNRSIEQIVYNPVREATPVGNNNIEFKVDQSEIVYSKKLHNLHRFLFRSKINYLYRDLNTKVDLSSIDVIHATTLFSDGALALKIKNKYNTPFIVAVRATDIDVFLKFRRDLIFKAIRILKEASTIIFISDSLKINFLNHPLIRRHKSELAQKCTIVYNGIDNYWLDNQAPKKTTSPSKILFVGRLISRKNIVNLAMAILDLNNKGIACEANFVGEGGMDEPNIKALAQKHIGIINYLGAIKEKEVLKSVYRNNHIFAMPSKGETFGLVYIEALSQGLPVLYSKNEGIDGVFDFEVGERCDGSNILDISNALEKMLKSYESYELDKIDFPVFRWENIAHTYLGIYTKVYKA
tara:strand:+ start:2621 stop:3745 length:1125 start_codon:yes stop_codon:yes gene_type:complete